MITQEQITTLETRIQFLEQQQQAPATEQQLLSDLLGDDSVESRLRALEEGRPGAEPLTLDSVMSPGSIEERLEALESQGLSATLQALAEDSKIPLELHESEEIDYASEDPPPEAEKDYAFKAFKNVAESSIEFLSGGITIHVKGTTPSSYVGSLDIRQNISTTNNTLTVADTVTTPRIFYLMSELDNGYVIPRAGVPFIGDTVLKEAYTPASGNELLALPLCRVWGIWNESTLEDIAIDLLWQGGSPVLIITDEPEDDGYKGYFKLIESGSNYYIVDGTAPAALSPSDIAGRAFVNTEGFDVNVYTVAKASNMFFWLEGNRATIPPWDLIQPAIMSGTSFPANVFSKCKVLIARVVDDVMVQEHHGVIYGHLWGKCVEGE